MTKEQKPIEEKIEEKIEEPITMSLEEAAELGLLDGLGLGQTMPRHTLIFDEEIDIETVQGLINEMANHRQIDLFFATNGGSLTAMDALIHYLNVRKDDIVIYLTDEICSAGTFLLTDFEGCVKLARGLDFILFHLGDRLTYANRKGSINTKELLKQLKDTNEEMLAKFEALGLTKAELKKIKAGHDVIIYKKDFHRLHIPCNEVRDEINNEVIE